MTAVLVIVLLALAAAIAAGMYFTFRSFNGPGEAADTKPARAHHRHDAAMTAQLKRFFQGAACAACGRDIPAVRIGERHPGLLNPDTREMTAWEDIPADDLSATLERHQPLCAHCVVTETFLREHPDLVIERPRIANP
jgi:hypothetical protein